MPDILRKLIGWGLPYSALVGGAVGALVLIETKPAPPTRSAFARVPDVATEVVHTAAELPPVVGYGTVRPKHQINIVPQVSGQLVRVHQELATGRVIPKGELLFEIDPTIYEARKAQAEAEVRRLEAALERTEQEMANLDVRIANAEKMLAIEEKDYETSKQLYERDHVGTRRDVDMVYQKYLRQKDALIELRNRRSVLPHVKMETEAQLEAARSRLKQAEHDLENTKIYCPFDARVEVVSAYKSQVVTAHFSIATLTDMSAFELPVGIDPRELRWLDDAIRPQALERRDPDEVGPEVTVRWSLRGESFSWRGHVTRFEKVDEVTRTARLVVEIRNVDMEARVETGSVEDRPTLTIGMYCRAELPVRPLEAALTVPRHAIYDNAWVYVVEPEGDGAYGRLARRRVPLLRSLGDRVLVDDGGRGGEARSPP
ncbi:MAG: biotin/lipoyl-binding protein, partial [Planctomycetota bacterium]